jgi:succinate dehydrogenase/fumarate reductase-like Fe-S protein
MLVKNENGIWANPSDDIPEEEEDMEHEHEPHRPTPFTHCITCGVSLTQLPNGNYVELVPCETPVSQEEEDMEHEHEPHRPTPFTHCITCGVGFILVG